MVVIRPAVSADLPEAADMHSAAFSDDEFMKFVFPYEHERPLAHKWTFVHRMKTHLSTPGTFMFVAVTEPADAAKGLWSGTEEIVGVAVWQRVGTDAAALAWKRSKLNLTTRFEKFLLDTERTVWDWLKMDPGVHYENTKAIYNESRGILLQRIPNAWFLRTLGVSAKMQRQGIGARLLEFGINNGLNEHVPIMLTASPIGEHLYRKCGFKSAYYMHLHETISMGVCMVLDPLCQYTRPLREGERKVMHGIEMELAWLSDDVAEEPAPEAEEATKTVDVMVAGQG